MLVQHACRQSGSLVRFGVSGRSWEARGEVLCYLYEAWQATEFIAWSMAPWDAFFAASWLDRCNQLSAFVRCEAGVRVIGACVFPQGQAQTELNGWENHPKVYTLPSPAPPNIEPVRGSLSEEYGFREPPVVGGNTSISNIYAQYIYIYIHIYIYLYIYMCIPKERHKYYIYIFVCMHKNLYLKRYPCTDLI